MKPDCGLAFGGYHTCRLPDDGHKVHQCGTSNGVNRCCQYDAANGCVRYSVNNGPWGDWVVATFKTEERAP